MIVVNQKTLELYEWSKVTVSTTYFTVGGVAFFVVLAVGSVLTTVFPSADLMGFVFIASVIGAILAPLLILYKRSKTMRMAEQDRGCQILKRWEQYTQEKASAFPMSPLARQLKIGWATLLLCDLATLLNKTYKEQEETLNDLQRKGSHSALCQTDQETYLARAEKLRGEVELVKDRYLGAWNVLTDGKDGDGSGILCGNGWNDPEQFRKDVLSGKIKVEDPHAIPVLEM